VHASPSGIKNQIFEIYWCITTEPIPFQSTIPFAFPNTEFVPVSRVNKEGKLPIAIKPLKQEKPIYSANTSHFLKRPENSNACGLQPHLEESCINNFNPRLLRYTLYTTGNLTVLDMVKRHGQNTQVI